MSDFSFKTIGELSAGLSRKEFSPVELLDATVARIETLEPSLNMFCHTDFAAARVSALESESRILRGEKRGDLDGIPTSIKDLIAVKGMPQRFGSRASSSEPSGLDAPSVERLRNAGAIILGKPTYLRADTPSG